MTACRLLRPAERASSAVLVGIDSREFGSKLYRRRACGRVLRRRYSHQQAARIASPLIGVAGLVGGAVAARAIPGSPSLFFNAVLWGVIGGFAGYIVFASEGPQQRPASIAQAAVADGVVAGIITALSGGLIDVISASGAGSSTHGSLSVGGAVLAVVFAGLLGALVGELPARWHSESGGASDFNACRQLVERRAPPKAQHALGPQVRSRRAAETSAESDPNRPGAVIQSAS